MPSYPERHPEPRFEGSIISGIAAFQDRSSVKPATAQLLQVGAPSRRYAATPNGVHRLLTSHRALQPVRSRLPAQQKQAVAAGVDTYQVVSANRGTTSPREIRRELKPTRKRHPQRGKGVKGEEEEVSKKKSLLDTWWAYPSSRVIENAKWRRRWQREDANPPPTEISYRAATRSLLHAEQLDEESC